MQLYDDDVVDDDMLLFLSRGLATACRLSVRP